MGEKEKELVVLLMFDSLWFENSSSVFMFLTQLKILKDWEEWEKDKWREIGCERLG